MSYEKPRIQLTDSLVDVVRKMANGNPGAITVLMTMLKEGQAIDPQGLMGGFGAILNMDTCDIYEDRIWMLFKDVCGENMVNMMAVLRANQLGFLSTKELNAAIDGQGATLNVADLLEKVMERLPEFNPETKEGEPCKP